MKLGLDIGNSAVKGALLNDKNVIQSVINFPSAITHISDAKYLTFVNEGDFYIQVVDSALEHFEGIVAIGDKAMSLPGYIEYDVTSSSYKTNHPITTSMLFGSIAGGISNKDKLVSVKLAVSIPIVESKSLGLVKDYNDKLIGKHVVRIYRDGVTIDVAIDIVAAKVVNEGQAGFFGLLDTVDKPFRKMLNTVYVNLDEDEDPVPSLEDFLVCDIGEGTSDISVFRNKKFNPDYSFSVTKGVGNLLEDAMANARREKLTIESRKDLQHVLESTNKRQAKRREQWMEYITPTENAFIDTIVDTIIKAYGNRDYFDAIIFFGGGFSLLTGYAIENDKVVIRNTRLFDVLNARLAELNKTADLIFGIAATDDEAYSQTINQRGLVQLVTGM